MAFFVEDDPDGVTWVLTVTGELETGAVAEVRRRLAAATKDGRRVLIVDLSEVEYIDTTAIAMLIDSAGRAERARVRLTVVSPPESRAGVLFSLTEADRILPVEASLEAALGAA